MRPQAVSRIRVRYAETDQMGVVYHANYFVWFEVGRTDLFRDSGWSYRDLEAEGVSLPVIEAQCEYQQPARYDDELEVRTTGALKSLVRVEFAYQVVRPHDGAALATGRTVHAALDREGRPCRLPARVRELFDEIAASPGGGDGPLGRPALDKRNGASASASEPGALPGRPVLGKRERNGASASASGGGAPRESDQ